MEKRKQTSLLIVTGAYHTGGGIAAVNRLVIQAIAEHGYSILILALLESDPSVDARSLPLGAQVRCRAFAGNKLRFAVAVWWAIMSHSYTQVYVDHVNLASLLAPLGWLGRCNYVVWLHGVEVFPPRPDAEGRLGLLGARKRLASSEFTRQRIADRFPNLAVEVCEPCLEPARNGGTSGLESALADDHSLRLEAVDASEQQFGEQVILHVGRMSSREAYKGQDTLLRAFPRVLEQYPEAQLVLIGSGDDVTRLRRIAAGLPHKCQQRIFMPGYLPDKQLEALYRKCYVFAMPSLAEGFGLVYLEAMSHGKPCLGSKVDATPGVVRAGITGLLVNDPQSAEEVAATLSLFLSHPEESTAMGRRGAELARTYYSFEQFGQRFWKALERPS